ncbi:DUF1707 domain-containing protein [Solwaraspora sp. WMMD406]|uniref:DUF1707 SHOCT-like domain-containing protein n=1 Tax=Solwaraspora sp. WMMD406 TaxID=3016095 RepID=UPI0024166C8E|nr:DUF1707 domain-containing protein [Solwaraspora sp. WMMD406]MDG4763685.1 DUF1707 domain-containing protein [Solwaraspora sp. WMMD406]
MDRRDGMRAGDSDREAVADRLRTALSEGRLDITEFDERLQRAYAAKTYGDLNGLLDDLPPPAGLAQSQLVPVFAADLPAEHLPGPDGRYPAATRRWLADQWNGYGSVVSMTIGIWAVISLMSQEWLYFWPGWVAGPWGAVLLVTTVLGLLNGEPQRWAGKQAAQELRKREKAERKRIEREEGPSPA